MNKESIILMTANIKPIVKTSEVPEAAALSVHFATVS